MNQATDPLGSSVVAEEMFTVKLTPENVARFWGNTDQSGGDGACWNWKLAKTKRGYGILTISCTMQRSHRVAFFIKNGPYRKSLFVCHSCDNPTCCNPAHLFLGTELDNIRDMIRKKRGRWGASMTMEKAEQIRSLYAAGGITMQKIADRFETCLSTVSFIVNRKSWV